MKRDYIIRDYIETQLFKGLYLTKFDKYCWCVDGLCVIMFRPIVNELLIKQNVFMELMDVFSLTTEETRNYFKNWAIKKFKLPYNLRVLN